MDTKLSCRFRRAQAMIELAFGMFALSLVIAVLIAFANYILTALDLQRPMRADVGRSALELSGESGSMVRKTKSDSVEVEPLAAEYVFGDNRVKIREKVALPQMNGILVK